MSSGCILTHDLAVAAWGVVSGTVLICLLRALLLCHQASLNADGKTDFQGTFVCPNSQPWMYPCFVFLPGS